MKSKTVFVFLGALTLLRCVWLAFQGIAPQEAYYWMCADRLAPAFFDGPPGTALLVHGLGMLTGDSLGLIRLAWPILGFAAAWCAWLLARSLFDEAVAGWVVVALNAIPAFNEQSVTIGPMMPSLVLILAAALIVAQSREDITINWYLAAVFLSLAALFRYEAVLFSLGLCFYLRRSIFEKDRSTIIACATVVLLPLVFLCAPLAWNASLGWVPIAGGTLQTLWHPRFSTWGPELAEFFRLFSFGMGMVIFVGFFWLIRASRKSDEYQFLLGFCAPGVIWAIYAFIIGGAIAPAASLAFIPILIFLSAQGIHRRFMPVVGTIVVCLALFSSAFMLRQSGVMRGMWAAIASEINTASREIPASEGGGFLVAENADQASILAVYFKTRTQTSYPPIFVTESPAISSQFGLWPSYADFIDSDKIADEYFTEQKGENPFIGRNALFLGSELPQTIKGAFAEIRPLRQIQLPNGTQLTVFLCLDYQTLPL